MKELKRNSNYMIDEYGNVYSKKHGKKQSGINHNSKFIWRFVESLTTIPEGSTSAIDTQVEAVGAR